MICAGMGDPPRGEEPQILPKTPGCSAELLPWGAGGYRTGGLQNWGDARLGGAASCRILGLDGLWSCDLREGGIFVLPGDPSRPRGCVAIAAARVLGDKAGGPPGAPALEGGIA